MSELGQHLDRLEALAGELSAALRAPWLRTRDARPLSRAVRELLGRTFHTLEQLRAEPDEGAPLLASEGLERRLYLMERDLDAARQLLNDAAPADALDPAHRRSRRYFELVALRIPDAFVVRSMRQCHRLGHVGEGMLAVTDDIELRVKRFLEVLSTDKRPEASSHGERRAWSKRFLPDFWDLELIKRQKKK